MTPEGKALLRRLCPHEPACRTHVDLIRGVEAAAAEDAYQSGLLDGEGAARDRADTGELARLRAIEDAAREIARPIEPSEGPYAFVRVGDIEALYAAIQGTEE